MEKKYVLYCFHCGNESLHQPVHKQPADIAWNNGDGGLCLTSTQYHIFVCDVCNILSLYADPYYEIDEFSVDEYGCDNFTSRIRLLWPPALLADESIPKEILEVYHAALKIKLKHPNSFAVQIRKALEIICLEQGVKGKTLNEQLINLITLLKLPELLQEITCFIRIVGIAGAHPDKPNVTYQHANFIHDFFLVVLQFIYIAPCAVKKFKNIASEFKI